MKSHKIKIFQMISIALIFSFLFTSQSFAGDDQKSKTQEYYWKRISGRWRINTSQKILTETRGYSRRYGYSPLVNRNSIISIKKIENFNRLSYSFTIKRQRRKKIENLFIFGADDFRNFYALKLIGGKKGVTEISLINCASKDKTLSRDIKWNFRFKEVIAKECKLPYDTQHEATLIFKKKKTILQINGKKIFKLSHKKKVKNKYQNGRFGFTNFNALLIINKIQASKKKKIIFEDDFSKDTIMKRKKRVIFKKTTKKK